MGTVQDDTLSKLYVNLFALINDMLSSKSGGAKGMHEIWKIQIRAAWFCLVILSMMPRFV